MYNYFLTPQKTLREEAMPQHFRPQSDQQANYLAFVEALRNGDNKAALYLVSDNATFRVPGQTQPLDFDGLVQHRRRLRSVFPAYGEDVAPIKVIEQDQELAVMYDVTTTVDGVATTIRCVDIVTLQRTTGYIANVTTVADRLPLLAPECDMSKPTQ